jgi:hypothetical protein
VFSQLGDNDAPFVDINEQPVEGVKVTIEVTEGPNKGEKGSGTTDSKGEVSFTYKDTGGVGTDKLKASFVDGSGKTHESNTVEVIWEEARSSTCGKKRRGLAGASARAIANTPIAATVAAAMRRTIEPPTRRTIPSKSMPPHNGRGRPR